MVTLLVGIAGTGTMVLAAGLDWIVKVQFDIRKDMHAMENRLSGRIGKVESAIEKRIGKVESAIAVLAERIDERTKGLEARVDDRTRATERRTERLEVRFDHKFGRPTPTKTPEKEKREKVPA